MQNNSVYNTLSTAPKRISEVVLTSLLMIEAVVELIGDQVCKLGDALVSVDGGATFRLATVAEYSDSATYDKDEQVVYKGNIYKAKAAIDTAEDWTVAHWDLIGEYVVNGVCACATGAESAGKVPVLATGVVANIGYSDSTKVALYNSKIIVKD